jgi:hypothetical protein
MLISKGWGLLATSLVYRYLRLRLSKWVVVTLVFDIANRIVWDLIPACCGQERKEGRRKRKKCSTVQEL